MSFRNNNNYGTLNSNAVPVTPGPSVVNPNVTTTGYNNGYTTGGTGVVGTTSNTIGNTAANARAGIRGVWWKVKNGLFRCFPFLNRAGTGSVGTVGAARTY
jgi:hypothetical protein